jgi:ribosomal protein S1
MAAEIIGFNDQRQQVELSRKALLPKPYQMFRQAHRIVSG